MSERIRSLSSAINLVAPGALVGIAGPANRRRPLALVRELARQRGDDIRLVGWAAGPEAGMTGATNLRVESVQAFRAAALGVDFLPVPGAATGHPTVTSPVSGTVYRAVLAVAPDVVLLHAEAADERGNVLLSDDPTSWANDCDLIRAARSVIVSVERLQSPLASSRRPRDLIADPDKVVAIVHAPFGSHPLAYPGEYDEDEVDPDMTRSPKDHWEYLDSVGFARLITRSTLRNEGTTQR